MTGLRCNPVRQKLGDLQAELGREERPCWPVFLHLKSARLAQDVLQWGIGVPPAKQATQS